jgi:hypothetical protein
LPIVVVLTGVVLSGTFAAVRFAGTFTDAGTVAAGFALERLTTAPPAGAGPVSVTVPVAGCPPVTAAGFTLKELSVADPTAGGLYPN